MARLAAAMHDWLATANWQFVQIADAADARQRRSAIEVPRRVLHSPAEYSARFEQHLRAGYSWINLNAAGIVDGVLIVLVETPASASDTPPEHVAVNLSGPQAGVSLVLTDGESLAPLAQAILQACDAWQAGGTNLVALVRRLEELSTQPDLPDAVRREVLAWSRQLAAAEEWSKREDIRGLGRAEGIVIALRAWTSGLPAIESSERPA